MVPLQQGRGVITRTTIVDDAGDEPPGGGGVGLHLLVMSPDAFSTVPLPPRGVLTIGRSTRSVIQIEDPMASREHARIHIEDAIQVEDVGSANGTRVRDLPIKAGELIQIAAGEAITIGSTVLMVQQNRSSLGRQRLWSHAYFETRLEAECARGGAAGGGFALVRLRLERPLPWTKLAPVFAGEVPPPHVFAAYGPDDYEILVIEKTQEDTDKLVQNISAALTAMDVPARAGVAWYPKDGRTVDALLARANARVRPAPKPESEGGHGPSDRGPAMARIQELAARAAQSTINVLILGETGVGKDVLSRTIHNLSPRADKPLLALNCAGLTESLIESELFGHERGAFSGATHTKAGLLETAEGGTVFLDEVGELPLSIQAKLLRVIETREVMRVGALKTRSIDVRFMSATNRELEEEVLRGTFRRDLFYRLNGITLVIPPLRERVSEIAALARTFVEHGCKDSGRPEPVLTEEVLDLLEGYSWPGNIRELKNVVERALVLSDGDIMPEHLPLEKIANDQLVDTRLQPAGQPTPVLGTPRAGTEERQLILDALEANAHNQTRAAAMLNMPRRTFVSKLDLYNIPRPQKGNGRK